MKISWKWLNEWVDLKGIEDAKQLGDLLTSRGLEVESIQTQGLGLERVEVALVKSKEKHPDADRLSLCQVETARDGILSIVCGAQNFKAGDYVALARVGAELPNGIKIQEGKIRGQLSQGMLCSLDELGLAKGSEGIWVLPESSKLGTPVAEILGFDDTILDLSITPNRGDCMSHLGIAREVAAATKKSLKFPKISKLPVKKSSIATGITSGAPCSQFFGIQINGIQVGPSPDWLIQRLEAVGARSINNVVDVTNWVLFEAGQPLHAYDFDRLSGKKLLARQAESGEKIQLLDDSTVALTTKDLVIADNEGPVALAGVMGGKASQVTNGTTAIYLEAACFASATVRGTARTFSKVTEASQRFERGVDPDRVSWALQRACDLILKVAGGQIVGISSSVSAAEKKEKANAKARLIQVPRNFFSERLGLLLSDSEIERSLKSLEFEVKKVAKQWMVLPPRFRSDVKIPEDLLDEVARSIGYEKIPTSLPALTSIQTRYGDAMSRKVSLRETAKDHLVALELSEALHYGFSSRKSQEAFGFQPTVALKNPMHEDQEVMVASLLPGLVEAYALNERFHFSSEKMNIRLFELRPTFWLGESDSGTGIQERWRLSMILSGQTSAEGLHASNNSLDFLKVKGLLQSFFERSRVRGVRWESASNEAPSFLHSGLSSKLTIGRDLVGWVGVLHPSIASKRKLRQTVFLVDLDWDFLEKKMRSPWEANTYKEWSDFPPMERDFAVLIKKGTPVEKLTQIAMKVGRPLAKDAKVFDIYDGQQVAEGMTSAAVRVIFFEEGRSLRDEEVDERSALIRTQWKQELGAELRGG